MSVIFLFSHLFIFLSRPFLPWVALVLTICWICCENAGQVWFCAMWSLWERKSYYTVPRYLVKIKLTLFFVILSAKLHLPRKNLFLNNLFTILNFQQQKNKSNPGSEPRNIIRIRPQQACLVTVVVLLRFGYRRVLTTTSLSWLSCSTRCSLTSTSGCYTARQPVTTSTQRMKI